MNEVKTREPTIATAPLETCESDYVICKSRQKLDSGAERHHRETSAETYSMVLAGQNKRNHPGLEKAEVATSNSGIDCCDISLRIKELNMRSLITR